VRRGEPARRPVEEDANASLVAALSLAFVSTASAAGQPKLDAALDHLQQAKAILLSIEGGSQ